MELRPEQLLERSQKGTLWPVYLIAGPEMLRVLEAADAVRTLAREKGVMERRVFDCESREFDWHQLIHLFQAPSLFSQRRLIELRLPTGQPGKVGADVLTQLCQAPPADVMCLIISHQWSKAHHGKWVDAISKQGVVSIAWPIKPHELPEWVTNRLRLKGIRADHAARQRLCERVEGNLLAASQEIDKLALLTTEKSLDAATMDALVADMARFDVFRLVDQVLTGHPAATVRIVMALRHEGIDAAAIMPVLIKETQRMATLASQRAQGRPLAAVFKELGIWPSRQAPFQRALTRHPQFQTWQHWLVQMAQIDRMIKGRAQGNPWRALERVLIAMANATPSATWKP